MKRKPSGVISLQVSGIHQKKKQQAIVQDEHRMLILEQEKEQELLIVQIYERAKQENGNCYMLSFDSFDNRKCNIDRVIMSMMREGLLHSAEFLQPLSNTVLFVAKENRIPLENFLHEQFPEMKFVLVRLYNKNFPKSAFKYSNINKYQKTKVK